MPKAAAVFRQQERKQEREEARGTPAERGYDYQWQQVSLRIRAERPVCEVCNNAASDDVDHIIPFKGKADPQRMDVNNLRAICRQCHNRKTHGGM